MPPSAANTPQGKHDWRKEKAMEGGHIAACPWRAMAHVAVSGMA